MDTKEHSTFTDYELLKEEKGLKSFSIMNAFLIGFLIGILFVSISVNAYGVFLLIPLFILYKFFNDPRNKKYKALKKVLKERNLR